MLEAQPLDRVLQLDVHAEVVGVELELVALAQPLVLMHRDFQSQNILIRAGRARIVADQTANMTVEIFEVGEYPIVQQDAVASQAALLLAIRAGVLGDVPTAEKLKEFPLPDVRALKRSRHLKVAEACAYLGASETELRQDGEPALEHEMTRLIHELYDKPCIEAAAALFEGAMYCPHPLVAVAGAAGYVVGGFDVESLPPLSLGFVSGPALLGIVCVSVFTAPLGARLAHALPVGKLKKVFALLLYVVATRMAWSIVAPML